MDSGYEKWDRCLSGTYSFDSMHNGKGVFKVRCSNRKFDIGQSFLLQRDEKAENGYQRYLWHHDNFWRLGNEYKFNKKDDYLFKIKSDGKKNLD